MTVTIGNSSVEFAAAVALMDDAIREDLHAIAESLNEQQFVDEYCRRHRDKFGSDFRAD